MFVFALRGSHTSSSHWPALKVIIGTTDMAAELTGTAGEVKIESSALNFNMEKLKRRLTELLGVNSET